MENFVRLLLAVLLMLTLVVAGCSSNSTSESEEATDTEEEVTYPEKEIKLYVPYSAGGSNDTAARIIADFMSTYLGKTVVVENKPGAGGVTQTEEFSRGEADGYHLQFSSDDPFTTLSIMHDNLSYTAEDFDLLYAPINTSTVIAVKDDSPYETIEDLIDALADSDEQISFSHPGVGTSPHFSGEVAFDAMNIKAQQVPYDGGGQALNALLGGDVDVQLTPEATILEQVEAGKVRALAVTSSERSPFLDVPTLKEVGYDIGISPVMSVYGPAGLPEKVKEVLIDAFEQIVVDPEFEKATEDLNLTIDGRTGEEVLEYFESANASFEKVADIVK